MLSDFRPADTPRLVELLQENFPEEEELYGMRPEALVRIIHRIYRWDVRFALVFMHTIGRPVFRFFTVEVDRRIVATTLVSYGRRASYLAMVMVDPAYRRRGYARQLLHASIDSTRRARRPYVALDVLENNTTARRLYESEGFLPLRPMSILVWTPPSDRRDPTARADPGIRPFRRSDAAPLVTIVNRSTPPEVAEVLPASARTLNPSGQLAALLASKTKVWVLDEGAGPVALVFGTLSEGSDAGHLSNPIVADTANPVRVAALLSTALDWLTAGGAKRVVTQVPLSNRTGLAALEGGGFQVVRELRTLYRPAS
ncbi:MAG: GNAT family N-acetyltransferase [Thermoplasmata archaeon]|jgi:ribosomal protein S18 acetylase RimI-like enzyme